MIFITGGTGLVGIRLIYDLVCQGSDVIALKRKDTPITKARKLLECYTSKPDEILDHVTWVEGDLLDLDALNHFIQENTEVYHCAAQVSFNPKDDAYILENNIDGTANLVNVCLQKGIKKLCHVSSIGAIGAQVNGKVITEETPWLAANKSNYSLSKYYSEMEVWRGIAEGLNAVIVNPAVILGAGDWNNGSPELFSRVASGMKYATLGSTSYVSVEDVSKAMIALMQSEVSANRFILAEKTLSYNDLFTKISQALGLVRDFKIASPLLTGLVWRLDKLLSIFSKNPPRITRHTHRIAHKEDFYSGEKIKSYIDFEYKDIYTTINEVALTYNKQNR